MQLKTIVHDSPAYEEMIRLRVKTLLDPIGVAPSFIQPEAEKEDILVGAFEDEELIGCCVLTRRDSTTIQLRQMAVKQDLQGKKVGTAIIRFAEELVKGLGYQVMMMHARDAVLEFYQHCGYQISGEPFTEVGIGHHPMQKQLC